MDNHDMGGGATFEARVGGIAVLVADLQKLMHDRLRLEELLAEDDPIVPGEFRFCVIYEDMILPLPPDFFEIEDLAALADVLRSGSAGMLMSRVAQLGEAVDDLRRWCAVQNTQRSAGKDEPSDAAGPDRTAGRQSPGGDRS